MELAVYEQLKEDFKKNGHVSFNGRTASDLEQIDFIAECEGGIPLKAKVKLDGKIVEPVVEVEEDAAPEVVVNEPSAEVESPKHHFTSRKKV